MPRENGPSGASVAGAWEQWATLSDALLRGLIHALNNRVTVLCACAQLGESEELSAEVARLRQVNAIVALLPARVPVPEAEALEIAPVLDDAIALHGHHPNAHGITCRVATVGRVQPVRAPRWALLRLLVTMVDAAKRATGDRSQGRVVLSLTGDEGSVRLRVPAASDGGSYGTTMARSCGGTLVLDAGELVLTLPSLAALRRREGPVRPEA